MSSSDEDTTDEIVNIKRAMKIAKARKHALQLNADIADETYLENQQLNRRLKDQCQKYVVEIDRLEQLVMARDEELKYTKRIMKKKEDSQEETTKSFNLKIKAIEEELKESFATAYKNMSDKNKLIEIECNSLLHNLTALERSTMHGHHVVPTKVNIGLMLKTKDSAERIKNFVISKEVNNAMEVSAPDNSLVDICTTLEAENATLKETIKKQRSELDHVKVEVTKASLIPQYRSAIIRVREELSSLKMDVDKYKARTNILREQLEQSQMDLQLATTEKIRMQEKYSSLHESFTQLQQHHTQKSSLFTAPHNTAALSNVPHTSSAWRGGGRGEFGSMGNLSTSDLAQPSTSLAPPSVLGGDPSGHSPDIRQSNWHVPIAQFSQFEPPRVNSSDNSRNAILTGSTNYTYADGAKPLGWEYMPDRLSKNDGYNKQGDVGGGKSGRDDRDESASDESSIPELKYTNEVVNKYFQSYPMSGVGTHATTHGEELLDKFHSKSESRKMSKSVTSTSASDDYKASDRNYRAKASNRMLQSYPPAGRVQKRDVLAEDLEEEEEVEEEGGKGAVEERWRRETKSSKAGGKIHSNPAISAKITKSVNVNKNGQREYNDGPVAYCDDEPDTEEIRVERELRDLDHEIGQLKSKLETAALVQTQNIVAQVISSAAKHVGRDKG